MCAEAPCPNVLPALGLGKTAVRSLYFFTVALSKLQLLRDRGSKTRSRHGVKFSFAAGRSQ